MKYEFEKVIDGLSKYINDELLSGMNDWQKFSARLMLGRAINNQETIKNMLIHNGFIRTFGVIDDDGMIDVKDIMKDIRREIEKQEKVSFSIPMFGKYTFSPFDVDNLYKTITGEELSINESN